MPLSEDEQRILTEIEHQLRTSDPDLARQVSETTVFSLPRRRAQLAIVGLAVGLVATVLLLGVSPYAAFAVGFGMMFVSALALERSIRHLVNLGLQQLATSVRSSGVKDMFGVRPHADEDTPTGDDTL